MAIKPDNDGLSYTSAFAITPTSDTEVSPRPAALLFDAAGTVTVRFESGGSAITLPVPAGIPFPLSVYSVDSIATATTVHGLV